MNAVPFDTLKLARKLEASGMSGAMAAGTAEAPADAMNGAELATKTNVADLRTTLKADIADVRTDMAALRTELKTDISALRTELKTDITGLRTELKFEISTLRSEFKADIELLRRDIVIRFGGMMVIAVGVLLTAIRYLPPHP